MTNHPDTHLLLFRRCVVLAGALLVVLALGLWTGLRETERNREAEGPAQAQAPRIASLRVVWPTPEKTASGLSPYGPGFERELITRFSTGHDLQVEWITADSREEAFSLLRSGNADLAVGFAEDPERDGADMARLPQGIESGKPYAHFRPVRVGGPDFTLAPRSDDDDAPDAPEYPLFSPAMDIGGSDSPLLLDPASFSLWLPLLGNARAEMTRDMLLPHRWFWRTDNPELAEQLARFWDAEERTEHLDELIERYYGFLPKRFLPGDIMDLWDAMQNRLPQYSDMILRAAERTGVPPLLLTAVIYRESRFNPDAVSETRVRGIMQLTTATAAMLGVNRNDPAQCIMGGARYLKSIWESLEDKDLDGWERWFMTLAAYNQGPGSLNGAMRISRQLGDSGTTWAELKKAYPRLRDSRGREAVNFVDSVRYYYFILHGLIGLAPPEMEHLATFLSAGSS